MSLQLVLGSSGFLGQHLVQRHLQMGNQVLGIDLNMPPHGFSHPDFHFLQGDVADPKVWQQLDSKKNEIKYLFHFASPASPHLFTSKSFEIASANVIGLMNALKFCESGGTRIIFASSSEVYGNPTVHPQPETYPGAVHCYGARGSYDESKRLGESLLFCANSKGAGHGILRIFNTYGPLQSLDDQRVVPQFVKTWREQNVLFVHGEGYQTRSFCYVDDLIQGIISYAESFETQPMNLGSEEEVSILKLAQIFQEISGTKPRIEHLKSPHNEDPLRRRPDLTRAKTHLLWFPSTKLNIGIEKTIKSYL